MTNKMMMALALGTWYLVRNVPVDSGPSGKGAVRHEPDYTLDRFALNRYDPTGALKLVIEGERLRHFPDDDIMEVETIRVVQTEPDGRRMTATALQGRARGDGLFHLLRGVRLLCVGRSRFVVC